MKKRKSPSLVQIVRAEELRISKLKGQAKSAATRRRNRLHAAIEFLTTPNPLIVDLPWSLSKDKP